MLTFLGNSCGYVLWIYKKHMILLFDKSYGRYFCTSLIYHQRWFTD